MFDYLITISPLGFLYGSAGGFLSPENLVGRSQFKFPPDAYTLSGLIFSANKQQNFASQQHLRDNLFVAGAFWANRDHPLDFYVPIPWTKIISQEGTNTWQLKQDRWELAQDNPDLTPEYSWQKISTWNQDPQTLLKQNAVAGNPWRYVSMLHPKLQGEQRCVQAEDGLFLENAVQLDDETCLAYLSTVPLNSGWYRFGGENHLVEINSHQLPKDHPIRQLLQQPIKRSFALISPAVWGSNRISYRYPQSSSFPEPRWLLTDKATPFRFRAGGRGPNQPGRLGRGRYAVKAGSVYIFEQPLNQTWWDSPEDWYPKEGYSLKHLGCGLSLPLDVAGLGS